MFAAALFTAAVAYYVHHDVGLFAAGLFMAQAVVLFIYSQHLAQPRKPLHGADSRANHGARRFQSQESAIVLPQSASRDAVAARVQLYTCRACKAGGFDTLAAVNQHKREDCPARAS